MDKIYLTLDVSDNNIKLDIKDKNQYRKYVREKKLSIILDLRSKYTLEHILEHYEFYSIESIKYYTMCKLVNSPFRYDLYNTLRKYKLHNDEFIELLLRISVSPIIQKIVDSFHLSNGSCIYALKLESGYYYIGYSNDILYRLTTHLLRLSGTSKLIKRYRVKKIIEIRNGTEEEEDRLTEEYKKKYGERYAEGGSWCSMKRYKDLYGTNRKNVIEVDIIGKSV